MLKSPPPPPVLAPKAFEVGGGPAGVVEGPPNEKDGADVAGPGVVEPVDVEVVAPNKDVVPPVDAPKIPGLFEAVVFAGVCRLLPELPKGESTLPSILFASLFWFKLKPEKVFPPPAR